MKGEGEQQLELDRRMIRQRIRTFKKQLEGIKVSRKEQSKRRQHVNHFKRRNVCCQV